ncbi:Uncharacterised protein [uncultured archaeon]|nr:Uncharacterised protein [uncultured archaeon]
MAERSPIDEFIGREVFITFENGDYMGRVAKPNYDLGYVDLLPSIVFCPEGKLAMLETESPTRLSLALFTLGVRYSITPQKDGFLEKKVEHINSRHKRAGAHMGFKQD